MTSKSRLAAFWHRAGAFCLLFAMARMACPQTPPLLLASPVSQHSYPGASLEFSVSAGGMTPLLFQWLKNGTNLIDGGEVAGSSTPTLSLGPVSANDAGLYLVVVSNSLASVTSSIAALTIGAPGTPISVLGFNRDVVVPNSARTNDLDTFDYAQPFDLASPDDLALYEQNLNGLSNPGFTKSSLGLPASGSFVSLTDGATVFQFAPYSSNNVLYLTPSAPSGSLQLSTPAAFDSLSILAASANGGGNGSCVLEFTDGSSSQPLAFQAPDWLTMTTGALTHFGSIDCGFYDAFYTEDYAGSMPNLYQTTISLDALGLNEKPLAAVKFTMPNEATTNSSAATGIFALSGTASVALQNGSSGGLNLSFPTVGNQSYTIEQTTNLSSGAWQIYQHVSGNGQPVQLSVPLANRQQFFRVTQP